MFLVFYILGREREGGRERGDEEKERERGGEEREV